jgi:hypothetical protein
MQTIKFTINMFSNQDIHTLYKTKKREFKFVPRIINPVKIANVVIFSAEERVRQASGILKESIPWIKVDVLPDPISASNYGSEQASVLIFDDIAMTLIDDKKIRKNVQDVVLVLLSSNSMIHCSPPVVAQEKFPYTNKADLVFAINHSEFVPEKILPSVVRCAEDKLNIEEYSKARRFIFLIVDDEPRWFSQFLPTLYNIIGQRADVMITRTYEETLHFLFGVEDEAEIDEENYCSHGHGDDVVCVITDIFFPKGRILKCDAGKDLFNLISKYYPRIPIIIASKAKESYDLKDFAFIMPKGDKGSLQILKGYIHDFTGMGDFFIRGKTGKIYHRLRNIRELYQIMLKAETNTEDGQELREILETYGRKDYFSTWLYMHGFRELADKLRPKRDTGKRLITVLKRHLKREILRMNDTPLIIDGNKVFNLYDLLHTLRTIDPDKIQYLSDNDFFSNWLDRKGYPELAEEFRPIHGSGAKLEEALADIVEKWIHIYERKEGKLR